MVLFYIFIAEARFGAVFQFAVIHLSPECLRSNCITFRDTIIPEHQLFKSGNLGLVPNLYLNVKSLSRPCVDI